jgi:CheY-like chemotaxis protein
MAEDDANDRYLFKLAKDKAGLSNEIRFVKDGQELLDYLTKRGPYASGCPAPKPGMILLDLNMPGMDGREALAEIKANPELGLIPIIVFTTSSEEDDIHYTYDLGVSSYITKPATFDGLVEIMKALGEYWFKTSCLPKR